MLNTKRVTKRGTPRRSTLFGFQSASSAVPKLINRLPKYRLHKSHARYQEEIANWQAFRQKQEVEEVEPEPEVTLKELQARRMRGYPVSIDELTLTYLDFARGYYVKNGRVTREAEIIGDMLRVLVRHHSGQAADDFGPVKLKELRERMIDEADWCRKHINRQISRQLWRRLDPLLPAAAGA